jgi:hypothetical protein
MNTFLPPQMFTLFEGERLPWRQLAKTILRSPGLVLHLWQLARNTRLAARQLSRALLDVVAES